MLNRVRIILIGTSHPGNIGAAARAMKTMGLAQLHLVAPELYPHEKATEMAASATDVLEKAVVHKDLSSAIADCTLVIGASARTRKIPWPMLTPREMAEKIQAEASTATIAILFGREQSGLTNDELQRCHWHLNIPANPDYSSLNLAAAVQVIAYELRVASVNLPPSTVEDYPLATVAEMESFLLHLETTLIMLNFLRADAPRKLMTRLRRFFARARPDVMEINIFRGILTAIHDGMQK